MWEWVISIKPNFQVTIVQQAPNPKAAQRFVEPPKAPRVRASSGHSQHIPGFGPPCLKQHFPAFSEPLIYFPLIFILTEEPPCYYSLLSCPKATECPWNAFAGRGLGNNQFLINCTGRKTHWLQIDGTYSVQSLSISWHNSRDLERSGFEGVKSDFPPWEFIICGEQQCNSLGEMGSQDSGFILRNSWVLPVLVFFKAANQHVCILP